MKENYREGTWFAVPLRKGGFGVGVVARAAIRKPIILCYFFGPKRESVPRLEEVRASRPQEAVLVSRVGDLGLIRGSWPLLGDAPLWDHSEWPMPVFVRREILPPFRNWRVYYSETDPNITLKEEIEPDERPDLPTAGSSGSGAIEIILTKLLAEGKPSFESSSTPQEKAALSASTTGDRFRVEVLSQLCTFGSNTNKPHSFDFYLYFPSEAAAHTAAEKVRERQFTAKVMLGADQKNWLCRVSKILVPESAPLDEIREFFEQLASTLHGDFDGWESDVVKP